MKVKNACYKVLVITLEGQELRQIRAKSILDEMGIDFEFLYGVDGRLGKNPLLKRFDAQLFLKRHGRYPVLGEAGCYASHFLAWHQATLSKIPTIILEDDFVLAKDSMACFELAARYMESNDLSFIRLEKDKINTPHIKLVEQNSFQLIRFLKIPQSFTGYMISQKTAAAFMEGSQKFALPVDYFVRYMHLHKQPIYALRPSPVWADDENIVSGMGDRRKRKAPFIYKLSRQVFRLKGMLLNGLYNIFFLKRDLEIRKSSKRS